MLSGLILENFKAFGRRQVIPMAPITLIFGANSSGKSSILQSLLLLKQSLELPGDSGEPLLPKGSLVDLGGFREMLYRHNKKLDWEIVPLIARKPSTREASCWPEWASDQTALSPSGLGFTFSLDSRNREPILKSVGYYSHAADWPAFQLKLESDLLPHERTATHNSDHRPVRVKSISETHPLWSELYDSFMEYMYPESLSRLLAFVGLSDPTEVQSSDDVEYLLRAQDAFRALSGDPDAAIREADSWLQAIHTEGPDAQALIQLAAEELKGERPIAASMACTVLYSLLIKVLGLDGLGEELVPSFLTDQPAFWQAWHIVEALTVLNAAAAGNEDPDALCGTLNRLDLSGRVDSDELISNEWLENVRKYLQQRLIRLFDYQKSNFVKDIEEKGALRSVMVRRFLPDRAPFRELIDGELRSALDLPYQNTKWRSWDSLPDPVQLVSSAAQALADQLERTLYFGPLRADPARFFPTARGQQHLEGRVDGVDPRLLLQRPVLVEKLNGDLERFGTDLVLQPRQLRQDLFEIRLTDQTAHADVELPDVGFGISQVLPILVYSRASQDHMILVEQPELHLHPRLQAELGSFFAECIHEPYGNQFIIETHSEHLILRIQRLIREGRLKSSDVSVVYVKKHDDGSRVKQLRLDAEGDFIDEWPDGFFEEGYEEMFAGR